MTLRYDLALAHLAGASSPTRCSSPAGWRRRSIPETLFRLAPIDSVVLGEGEFPLLECSTRWRAQQPGPGRARHRVPERRLRPADPAHALTREELRDATYCTPYEDMPYERYWRRLEHSYRVRELPVKAHREARLARSAPCASTR
jgi:hypothetical protein